MNHYVIALLFMLSACIATAQNTGIGIATPAARLEVQGTTALPTIPGAISTGIFRIGVTEQEGIDFGKMGPPLFTAWIQAGFASVFPDPISLQPQGGNVGIGTTAPAESAALDISSTSQGFLPPRLTYVQRNAISNPVAGLVVWCSNCGVFGELQVYRGTLWIKMDGTAATTQIVPGGIYDGKVVAYIFEPGDVGYVSGETHGFVANHYGISQTAPWGCKGTTTSAIATAIGTGNQNTYFITSSCLDNDIAASLCRYLDFPLPWCLPSKDELNKIYLNREAIGISETGYFWSSSQFNADEAWSQDFFTGAQDHVEKDVISYFLPIKNF